MFDIKTFVDFVRAMRNAQKKYFKTKDYNSMIDSKNLEELVDKKIKEWDNQNLYGPGLFGET